MQSLAMQTNWAEENLRVIRTLMERGAVYRRALAPVMGAVGVTGLAAAVGAAVGGVRTARAFAGFWTAIGVVCLAEAFALIRVQALKAAEEFWSPPTRRVAQAVAPAFLCGFAAGTACLWLAPETASAAWLLAMAWMALYGCALHAAGFFMPRGIKVLGWGFVVAGCLCLGAAAVGRWDERLAVADANWAMGVVFGGAHAAGSVYLYFTEKRGIAS
jgi:hypothetical protein